MGNSRGHYVQRVLIFTKNYTKIMSKSNILIKCRLLSFFARLNMPNLIILARIEKDDGSIFLSS